ncbi:MAG: hypothetical protein K6A97_07200 [Lachnospiraceae bacterium]|nr:hypothetical protein [Lachnospiraceae bacterium]
MYDFFEDIKERAEISVRELILSIACGVLLGFVAGLLLGSRKNRPPKPPRRIIIKETPEKNEGFILNPEDYD